VFNHRTNELIPFLLRHTCTDHLMNAVIFSYSKFPEYMGETSGYYTFWYHLFVKTNDAVNQFDSKLFERYYNMTSTSSENTYTLIIYKKTSKITTTELCLYYYLTNCTLKVRKYQQMSFYAKIIIKYIMSETGK
jgi:hypothetical protein